MIAALAYLLPAIALLLVLLARRFPGEQRLLALARRAMPRLRRRSRSRAPARGRQRALFPRGGELLARALAVRPPPAPAVRHLH